MDIIIYWMFFQETLSRIYFSPLNWSQYHKVYLITKQVSLLFLPARGISVFLNSWLRVHNTDVFHYFDTHLSIGSNITLLALGTVLAYFSLQSFFAKRKKSIQEILGKELGVPSYYQLRPQKPFRFFFSIFWTWLFLILLIIVFGIIFIYTGNLSFLLGFILMTFFYLRSVNGSFSTKEEWKYEIVDIKKLGV
ncbi:DUF443 domain-containing protein [Streptococcus pluranimalium]|uniref:DUF443 domain-containing protein n=1 Tax=Streptococcus pluranimalium TaxID=82348 RepID=A0A2L0D3I4_9STRE|nr:hypothetical protein [Streptococcus pluranimalium]AUW96366.1 hypothetical protein C0J00_04170 [Streptococcus pluranimalium]